MLQLCWALIPRRKNNRLEKNILKKCKKGTWRLNILLGGRSDWPLSAHKAQTEGSLSSEVCHGRLQTQAIYRKTKCWKFWSTFTSSSGKMDNHEYASPPNKAVLNTQYNKDERINA